MVAQKSNPKGKPVEKLLPEPASAHEKLLPTDLPKEIPAHAEHGHTQTQHKHTEEAYEDVEILLTWTASGRPFRKRGREYFLNVLLIALLIEVILFLFAQYPLMLVVASLVFVSFALATVPPRDFKYRISTEGFTVEDHFFLWQELYDFYFTHRDGMDVLHLRTHSYLPGELTISLGSLSKEEVKSALLLFLPYREVIRKTFTEKSGDWLRRNFPLEKHHHPAK